MPTSSGESVKVNRWEFPDEMEQLADALRSVARASAALFGFPIEVEIGPIDEGWLEVRYPVLPPDPEEEESRAQARAVDVYVTVKVWGRMTVSESFKMARNLRHQITEALNAQACVDADDDLLRASG